MSINQTYHASQRRKKSASFSEGEGKPNYLDVDSLMKLQDPVTKKIVPKRMSGVSDQRGLARAIKLARFLALLPYCDHHRE